MALSLAAADATVLDSEPPITDEDARHIGIEAADSRQVYPFRRFMIIEK